MRNALIVLCLSARVITAADHKAASQIPTFGTLTVSPNSVSVNSQGATSVRLTYNGVTNLQPMEATFCADLVPLFVPGAANSIGFGFKCKPGTTFGRLPQRYDQSSSSGNTFTDILTVTPQLARRLYREAARGNAGPFFYVRRFVHKVTRVEVAVPVVIRLSNNGAGVPLSLTTVRLTWGTSAKPIIFVKTSEELPQVQAEISYTGTGRLQGRWELVKPGDIPPEPRDLLTEATLPFDQPATPGRYPEISRFNLYLPPTGKILLAGPDVRRMDKSLTGLYQVLLRIEASDDIQSPGGGGVAGFPLPVIKYYVSNGSATPTIPLPLSPVDQATLDTHQPVDFTWPPSNAVKYHFEVEDLQGAPVISAILPAGINSYRAPSWFTDRVGRRVVRWRVNSLNEQGGEIERSEWRALRFRVKELK